MEGVRGQTQNINEVYDTIKRVASRLGITNDQATVLLLIYKWDEERLVSKFKQSPNDCVNDHYFVTKPVFNLEWTPCLLCKHFTACINLGCGDHFCDKCFREYFESKINEDNLDMDCPMCLKFLPHSWIKDNMMSKEVRKRYEALLLENFRHATKQPHTVTEEDSLLKKSGSQIFGKGKDLASGSGENKK
ncbi:Zinc finger RING-type [Arabidopsis thaliana x Arabidopsis arenosa]|uniref:Zinc finger RING-type n=1 Tax=Arabidopsis thaliana x Arabidopsis arenosa TaxID=1240361 RepID=A0A8T2A9U9_9BRAS|nr:Zinc finger RING-type [Arabidopsis thaliana x Arabidopsis arenosa]